MDGGSRQSRSSTIKLMAIVGVGLAIRLLPVVFHYGTPSLFLDSDSQEYQQIAVNLLSEHGYSTDAHAPYAANMYRPPLLPVLLAGLYGVIGISIPAAIALQAVVSSATIILTFYLARELTGQRNLALVAALVLALDPVAIQYSNLLLTETYTSFLLLVVACCITAHRRSHSVRWLWALGVLFAAGIMLHPVLLFLPPFLLVLPFLRRETRSWQQFAVALAAVAIAYIPASAWVARNYIIGDYFGISTVTAVNLLKYKAAGVEADLRGTTREIERDRLTLECEAELAPGATPGERCRLWQRRAAEILRAHPLTYAKVHAKGMALEFIGPERDHTTRLLYGSVAWDENGEYSDESIAADHRNRAEPVRETARYLILCWQGCLLLGLFGGIWLTGRSRPALLAILALMPLYILALSGGPESSPRFRVLYLPQISLLTAVGFCTLAASMRKRRLETDATPYPWHEWQEDTAGDLKSEPLTRASIPLES
jgi:4-amino-4-deoxy-L-arabinose transferase-like glycosyltransferase